LTNN